MFAVGWVAAGGAPYVQGRGGARGQTAAAGKDHAITPGDLLKRRIGCSTGWVSERTSNSRTMTIVILYILPCAQKSKGYLFDHCMQGLEMNERHLGRESLTQARRG